MKIMRPKLLNSLIKIHGLNSVFLKKTRPRSLALAGENKKLCLLLTPPPHSPVRFTATHKTHDKPGGFLECYQ